MVCPGQILCLKDPLALKMALLAEVRPAAESDFLRFMCLHVDHPCFPTTTTLKILAFVGKAGNKKGGLEESSAVLKALKDSKIVHMATPTPVLPLTSLPDDLKTPLGDEWRVRAQALIDPSESLLERVLGRDENCTADDDAKRTDSKFPPKQYCTPAVLSGLRVLGMRTLKDPRTFLEVAQKLDQRSAAATGSSHTADCSGLVKFLVQHFTDMNWSPQQLSSLQVCRILPCQDYRHVGTFGSSNSTSDGNGAEVYPPIKPPSGEVLRRLDADQRNRKRKKGKGKGGGGGKGSGQQTRIGGGRAALARAEEELAWGALDFDDFGEGEGGGGGGGGGNNPSDFSEVVTLAARIIREAREEGSGG